MYLIGATAPKHPSDDVAPQIICEWFEELGVKVCLCWTVVPFRKGGKEFGEPRRRR